MNNYTTQDLGAELREVEDTLSRQWGEFVLFALLMREDSLDKWDLVVSAFWVGRHDRRSVIQDIADALKAKAPRVDLAAISRIVVLDPGDPFVKAVTRNVKIEHGCFECHDCWFDGVFIRRGLIVTAVKPT